MKTQMERGRELIAWMTSRRNESWTKTTGELTKIDSITDSPYLKEPHTCISLSCIIIETHYSAIKYPVCIFPHRMTWATIVSCLAETGQLSSTTFG